MHIALSIGLYPLVLACTVFILRQIYEGDMISTRDVFPLASLLASVTAQNSTIDLSWHVPKKSWINDLSHVLNETGTHGFIFNSSVLPAGVLYGSYNWCNMPHVRSEEYPVASEEYQLEYVEVVRNSVLKIL
jgi:hypothetical protein